MTGYRYLAGAIFAVCCVMALACASWFWLAMAAGSRVCLRLVEE